MQQRSFSFCFQITEITLDMLLKITQCLLFEELKMLDKLICWNLSVCIGDDRGWGELADWHCSEAHEVGAVLLAAVPWGYLAAQWSALKVLAFIWCIKWSFVMRLPEALANGTLHVFPADETIGSSAAIEKGSEEGAGSNTACSELCIKLHKICIKFILYWSCMGQKSLQGVFFMSSCNFKTAVIVITSVTRQECWSSFCAVSFGCGRLQPWIPG